MTNAIAGGEAFFVFGLLLPTASVVASVAWLWRLGLFGFRRSLLAACGPKRGSASEGSLDSRNATSAGLRACASRPCFAAGLKPSFGRMTRGVPARDRSISTGS